MKSKMLQKLTILTVVLGLLGLLMSCSKKPTGPEKLEVVVSDRAVELSDATIAKVASYDSATGVLVFSEQTSDLQKLEPGKVVVLPVTEKTPYGALRRVEDVRVSQGQVILRTTQATLEDVFERASIEITRPITINDVAGPARLMKGARLMRGEGNALRVEIDADVCAEETQGAVTAGASAHMTGFIEIEPTFTMKLKIDDSRIRSMSFHHAATVKTGAEIVALLSMGAENEEGNEIASIPINPITIWAGWVPIVIVPSLDVKVGGKVEATCQFKAGVTQEASMDAGLEYNEGQWQPVKQFDWHLGYDTPELSGNLDVLGWVGPELDLRLYGVAGPHGDIKGFLELSADSQRDPWWQLDAGATVGLGVHVECLGKTLADMYKGDVIEYRKTLAQAQGERPKGTVAGVVKDAVTLDPIEGVEVEASLDGTVKGTARTGSDGTYSMQLQAGTNYVLVFRRRGYLPVEYHDVGVAPFQLTTLDPILQIDESYMGTGTVRGKVVDAITAYGVAGVSVKLRRGMNTRSGTIVAQTTTSGDGSYVFTGVEAGNYTAEASAPGYLPAYFSVNVVGGRENTVDDIALSPRVREGELRIVLTWGDWPLDLDSHLTGPDGSGGRFHVYYSNERFLGPNGISAELDRDDRDGFGPETITLTGYQDGLFRYSVHDFSNSESTWSKALSNSDAVVRVYGASGVLASFHVPYDTEGTLWTVFEILNGQIVPRNIMSYEEDPANVRKVAAPYGTDAPLMWGLPEKP